MSEWIATKDRWPDVGLAVLVTDGKIVTAARYSPEFHKPEVGGNQWWWWDAVGYGGHECESEYDQEGITHWMPLPLPPLTTGPEQK